EAVEQPATAGGAVAPVPDPCDIDVERAQLRDDLVRELVPGPIVLDDRCDFGLHEITYALDNRPFLRIEQIGNPVEIGVDGRRIFLLARTRHGRHVILHSVDVSYAPACRGCASGLGAALAIFATLQNRRYDLTVWREIWVHAVIAIRSRSWRVSAPSGLAISSRMEK